MTKVYLRRTRKFLESKFRSRNLIIEIKIWGVFGTILEIDEGRMSTNEPEKKKI